MTACCWRGTSTFLFLRVTPPYARAKLNDWNSPLTFLTSLSPLNCTLFSHHITSCWTERPRMTPVCSLASPSVIQHNGHLLMKTRKSVCVRVSVPHTDRPGGRAGHSEGHYTPDQGWQLRDDTSNRSHTQRWSSAHTNKYSACFLIRTVTIEVEYK